METPAPPTTTTATTIATIKTDLDSDSPPSTTLTKQLLPPFTNGYLKRHKPLHHHPPPPLVSYKECLKNHAATIGCHATDGCGEFMPSPTSSLTCAACGCHRNFHRRDSDESPFLINYQPHHRHHPPPPPHRTAGSPGNSPSPPPISSSYYPPTPHMALALTTVFPTPPADTHQTPANPTTPISGSNPGRKKRFRTIFTQDQKQKMLEIAERVDWKIQKCDEDMIIKSCNEIGVDKSVFKVWMHNNKTTFGIKKDVSGSTNCPGDGIDFIVSRNHHQKDAGNNCFDHHVEDVICGKGSSSCS